MSSDREPDGAATGGSASDEAAPLLAFADALLSAGQAEVGPASAEVRQYVTFFVRDDEFGISILRCREIVRVPSMTRIPEAPVHVRGVVNLRGRIVPAVDTRLCLGLDSVPATAKSRLIVVDVAGRSFALLVDRVARVLKLPVSEIAPQPEGATPPAVAGFARVGDAIVQLVDVERMLRAGPGAGEARRQATGEAIREDDIP
jgi:purine-binding chemotaxis protein CheW